MLATEPNMTNVGVALKLLRILFLFVVTALAEIVGCYLPWLVIKQGKPLWLLLPAAISLGAFAWLLTLHEPPRAYLRRVWRRVHRTGHRLALGG